MVEFHHNAGRMNPNDILQQMRDSRRTALHLVGGGSGGTKLGGLPRLPSSVEWPTWEGDPLAFLAQISLDELPVSSPLEGLPREGMLYFFYDARQTTWGFSPQDRGSWRVIYAPTPGSSSRPAPVRLEVLLAQKRLRFAAIDSYPGWDRLDISADLPFDEARPLIDAAAQTREAPFEGRPRHQMGGYPSPEQGDQMELECQLVTNGLYCGDASGFEDPRAEALRPGAQDWQLLLQLDSDDEAKMMWGDAGRLYFWIRRQDLEKQDFSNAWMVLQCG
jgi:uncharacterized protein YwqG